MNVIGIDPGKKGGIAVLKEDSDIDIFEMPLIDNNIDEKSLFELFEEYSNGKFIAYLELVHAMPKQGVTSMFTFGMGYGMVKMALIGNRIPYHLVTPQSWKKTILKDYPKEKSSSILYVQKHYPKINLIIPPKRTPSDGIADAICIADYGKIKLGETQ